MRQIIFRGKRFSDGAWVYGNLVIQHYAVGDSKYEITGQITGEYYHRDVVDKYSVGQFTGLTDKNGKKIYDGDIVLYGASKKLVVWWNDEAFQWQAKEKRCPVCTFDGTIHEGVVWDNVDFGWIAAEIPICGKMTTEVIGNIFDNPDLLE